MMPVLIVVMALPTGQATPQCKPARPRPDALPFERMIGLAERTNAGSDSPDHRVIRDRAAWAAWVNRPSARAQRLTDLHEKIDFEGDMVLCVASGERYSGGHSIAVVAIHETPEHIEVIVHKKPPLPGMGTTAAHTYPCDVVRVRRSDKPVCFKVLRLEYGLLTPYDERKDGPVDPNIVRDFGYSATGRALVLIKLALQEWTPSKVEQTQDRILESLPPWEFELVNRGSNGDLLGRMNARGLEKVVRDPAFGFVRLYGSFSGPEEIVPDYQSPCKHAGAGPTP